MSIDPRFYELAASLNRGGAYAHYWIPSRDDGRKYSYWYPVNGHVPEPPASWLRQDLYYSVNPAGANVDRSVYTKIHARAHIDQVETAWVGFVHGDPTAHDLRAALAAATQQADADRATLMQQRARWKDEAYAATTRTAELEAKLAAVPHNAFLRMSYGAQTPEDEHVAQMWIASIDWQAVQP